MPNNIDVQINRRDAYNILLGFDLWDHVIEFCSDHYDKRKIFVIIDSKVCDLYGQKVEKECRRYFRQCHIIEIPVGEKSKSLQQWKRLQNELLVTGVERTTPLLAVGGGVTGDLGGFAASTVLRGIPLIHMPTSLLAMVDSSIGGKTGVNHSRGKNLIGAFYQPDAIFADMHYLRTLDRKEWINGMAEMLKYAAIQQPTMFNKLSVAVEGGFQPSEQWLELIEESAVIKADIVQQDERESGLRSILNFGHSFGHALERLAGYGNVSHGEAVFVGMFAAIHVSRIHGFDLKDNTLDDFKSLYKLKLPAKDQIPDLVNFMQTDKKVKDETIRLVLLKQWGKPFLEWCGDEALLEEAWQAALNTINR
jgi:3-dehydroquinate synthase